jgi:hypothetical protein
VRATKQRGDSASTRDCKLRRGRNRVDSRRCSRQRGNVATLPRALHAKRARLRKHGSTADGSRADQRGDGARDDRRCARIMARRRGSLPDETPEARCSMTLRTTFLRSGISHAHIASKSRQPIRWSGLTRRSNAGRMSSASSPTTLRSCGLSARCCSNRTTSGSCSAPTFRSKDPELSATIRINGFQP